MSDDAGGLLIRPLTTADVAAAEQISDEAFHDADLRLRSIADPEPVRRTPEAAAQWRRRTEALVAGDPGGCWMAELDGVPAGVAVSARRENLWFLASYAVTPGLQGRGIGRPLLDAALSYARGCLRGMLSASADPAAYRRYRLAGFGLHPQVQLHGVVDRTAIPVVTDVREGSPADLGLLDSVDRHCRDAGHGPDHRLLAESFGLLITERSTGTGYVYVRPDGAPALLAATNRRTAARLLWAALAAGAPGEPVTIRHVTAVNDWAVDVGLAARLAVSTSGYLGVRGMRPPLPYLHHGALL